MEASWNYMLAVVLFALQILSQHKALAIGEKCRLIATNQYGTCIDIKHCTDYLRLLQVEGQRAAPFLRSTICYYQDSSAIVCCPSNTSPAQTTPPPFTPPQVLPTPAPTPPPTPRPTPSPVRPYQNTSSYWPIYPPQCGDSPTEFHRVVGGRSAKLGAWPWVAALGYVKPSGAIRWLCGGSLVSRRHIITAAHCVYNRTDLSIARLGEHDLYNDNDGANPVDVYIRRGILHPKYNPRTYENDVAILRLKDEIVFNEAIHPICLPLAPDMRNRDITGKRPFIAGWGALYFRGPSSAILQEVQLPVVTPDKCKTAFSKIPQEIYIDERVLCAGYAEGGQDACQGDSGGGLMFPNQESFYLFGIVSFGFRCAEAGFPGVYTKITHFLDFILNNLK